MSFEPPTKRENHVALTNEDGNGNGDGDGDNDNDHRSGIIIEYWCFNIVFTLHKHNHNNNNNHNHNNHGEDFGFGEFTNNSWRESYERKLGEAGRDMVNHILEGSDSYDMAYEVRTTSTRAMNQNCEWQWHCIYI